MADNGSKTRPVRTLTVKNFSVIKEAKLELGKITVLIGPQASGKSLLCKLAYFLGGEILDIAVDSLLDRYSWDDFLKTVGREFKSRFLTAGWLKISTKAAYTSLRYSVTLDGFGDPLNPEIRFSFSNDLRGLYSQIGDNPSKQLPTANRSRNELKEDLRAEVAFLKDFKHRQSDTYIPAGRALFTGASKSIVALQNPDIDQLTRQFAGLIAWDSRWKIGYLTTGRNVLQDVQKEMYRIADGTVVVVDGAPRFLSRRGHHLPFSAVSSGTLELLPLFNIVDQLACSQEDMFARTPAIRPGQVGETIFHSPCVFLEEPEANIFPSTQYDLVKLFAWLAVDPVLDFDWVITTHSPYVLSGFNNLILAGQLGQDKRLKKKLKIDERFWVEPGTFKAYSIHDGKLESILSDSGLIDGEYLDGVSEGIGNEFNEMLRLEYGKKKAS